MGLARLAPWRLQELLGAQASLAAIAHCGPLHGASPRWSRGGHEVTYMLHTTRLGYWSPAQHTDGPIAGTTRQLHRACLEKTASAHPCAPRMRRRQAAPPPPPPSLPYSLLLQTAHEPLVRSSELRRRQPARAAHAEEAEEAGCVLLQFTAAARSPHWEPLPPAPLLLPSPMLLLIKNPLLRGRRPALRRRAWPQPAGRGGAVRGKTCGRPWRSRRAAGPA